MNSWGGPGQGYDWPLREHGLSIDHKGNVWIGGNDDKDSQVLKFTSAGKFVLQIGRPGQKSGSNDKENFWRPAKSSSIPGRMKPTSRTDTAIGASSSSMRTAAGTSAIGARTARPG